MNPSDFEFLSALLKQRSGLVLQPGKEYLLESRLTPLAREQGLTSLGGLVQKLRGANSEDLKSAVTEAMTTNESSFFRDRTPFEHFDDVILPKFLESRVAKRSLRIWSAAASTGQEPYSLAMALKEAQDQRIATWKIDIIATDISPDVLEKAKAGLYSQFEVQRGLPIGMLMKYFTQNGPMWQIDSSIRAMVRFQYLNLLDSFANLGQFDVIFCRNVLIYFDKETKIDVLNRLAAQLAPDGYVILGAAETVLGLTDSFQGVTGKRGLFEKPQVQAAGARSGTVGLRQASSA